MTDRKTIEIKSNEDKAPEFNQWMKSLYDVTQINDEELQNWYDVYQYKGFDRMKILKQLKNLVKDVKEVMQIILICAIRGPQRAAQTKLMSGQTIESYRIPGSGMKGKDGISCQRITAATADLAAFFMKKLNVPKRINVQCPGWLQFPSAGSIRLPEDLRLQHIEFHQRFSTVIGGVFNEQIYQQMANNSYLDLDLGLFDDHIPQQIGIMPQVPYLAPTFNPVRGDVGTGSGTPTVSVRPTVSAPPPTSGVPPTTTVRKS